jgi:hypothetical protein
MTSPLIIAVNSLLKCTYITLSKHRGQLILFPEVPKEVLIRQEISFFLFQPLLQRWLILAGSDIQ